MRKVVTNPYGLATLDDFIKSFGVERRLVLARLQVGHVRLLCGSPPSATTAGDPWDYKWCFSCFDRPGVLHSPNWDALVHAVERDTLGTYILFDNAAEFTDWLRANPDVTL